MKKIESVAKGQPEQPAYSEALEAQMRREHKGIQMP